MNALLPLVVSATLPPRLLTQGEWPWIAPTLPLREDAKTTQTTRLEETGPITLDNNTSYHWASQFPMGFDLTAKTNRFDVNSFNFGCVLHETLERTHELLRFRTCDFTLLPLQDVHAHAVDLALCPIGPCSMSCIRLSFLVSILVRLPESSGF